MTAPLIPCENCLGDGTLIYVGGPGHFDSAFGNYLPDEHEVICEECQGQGEIEAEPCPCGEGYYELETRHGEEFCQACLLTRLEREVWEGEREAA